jgi:tetratricopeptide (TPR) repeat protein
MDLAALEEAFRRDPGSSETFSALRRNYQTVQREDALAPLYERHAASMSDARRAAELCWQASELYGTLGHDQAELRALRKALARDQNHRRALERLIALAEAAERWSELTRLYDTALEQLEARGERMRLGRQHFIAGQLWETRFDRLDRAIEHYQAAFKNDPEHAEAIDAGRRIYATVGRWQTVAQLYQVELTTVHEARRKAELLLELAELSRDKLGDLEATARALTEASQLRPGEEPILEALGEVYASPHWPAPGGLDRAAQIFIQIAQRREARSDRDGAIAYLRRALGADPENEAAAARLERAYRETGRWEDLDRLFRQRLSVVDESAAMELALRRGELLERKLGDRKGARECYEALLEDEPVGGRAEGRLRDIYRTDGNWELLLTLDERALAATGAQEARIRLLLEMATLHHEHLEAPETAAQLLHEVLQLDPQQRRALAAYEGYFRDKGDSRNLAELLRFSAQSARERGAPPMEVCSRLEELAEICERKLGDLPGALEAWEQIAELHHDVRRSRHSVDRLARRMRQVHELARSLKVNVAQAVSPGERRAALMEMAEVFFEENIDPLRTIEILREVLEVASSERALELLEQLYEREADDEGLAWVLRQRVDAILTRPERLSLLSRLAELYRGALDRQSDARWALEQLVELDPQNDKAQDTLEKLLEQAEDYQGLAKQLERRAQVSADGDKRLGALRQLGKLMDQTLASPTHAIEAWERVLDIDERDPAALESLDGLYQRKAEPAKRSVLLRRRLEISRAESPVAQAKLLREVGRIAEQDLGRPEEAIEAYEELTDLLPADRDALAALARLYGQLERHGALVQVLDRQIELAEEPEERAGLAFRQVDVLEEKLGDLDEAARCYEQIIREIAPGDLDGYRRLRRLHGRRGEHRRACELAEIELFLMPEATPVEDRTELALELADAWWDELQDAQRATLAYERVIQLAPGHPSALAALRKLYHRVGAHGRLVELAPQLFGALDDDRERQILLFEVAQVWERELEDPQQAFEWFRRAFDLYPGDGSALAELRRMADSYAFWPELLTVYEESRKRSGEAEQVLELTDAMVAICREHLDDPAKAFNVLRQALAVDPAGERLLAELEQLADDTRLHADLYDVYQQLLPACSPERRRELLRRRAEVAEQRLADTGRALEDVIRLRREVPDPATLAELLGEVDRLAVASGRHARGLGVHLDRLQGAETSEQLEILGHVAGLLEGPMSSPGRAFDAWLHALLIAPEVPESLSQAWRLAEQLTVAGQPQTGARLFGVDGEDEDDEAIELLDIELLETSQPSVPPPSPPAPPPLQIRASAPRDDEATIEIGDGDALEIVEEPLRRPPSPPPRPPMPPARPTVETGPPLREPPREGSWWQRLADTLRLGAEGLARVDRAQRLLEVARVLADGARDDEQAFMTLTEAAILDLDSEDPRQQLEALAADRDAWPRLFAAYHELLESASRGPVVAGLHLRFGLLLREHGAGDEALARATEQLEAVLAIAPGQRIAAGALREIYSDARRYDALATMLERQLEALDATLADEERAERLRTLADLFEHHLGRPQEAASYLERYLRVAASDAALLARLADLHEQVGQWAQLVETLEQLVEGLDEGPERASALLRMARALENELELPHRAIACYRRAVELDPQALEALGELQRLYAAHDQTDELVSILKKRLAAGGDPPTLRSVAVQLSRVLEALGRLDEAADALVGARGDASDPDLDERLAQVLVSSGRTADAVELLQERAAAARAAGAPAAEVVALLVRLARLLDEKLGRADQARDSLTEALTLDGGNLEALEELAAVELRAGSLLAHADVVMRICERLAGGEAVVQRLLDCAALLRDQGELERARELYELVLRSDRQQPSAINALLGLVDAPERRLELLTRKLESASADDPRRQAKLLIEIGDLQRGLERPATETAGTYQRALELCPDYVPAIDALSTLMIDQEQLAPARLLLERSIERIAKTPEVQQAGQLYYRLAQLFEREGRDDEGCRYLTEAVRLRPKDLLVRLALGQNRYRAGRWRDALRHLREALDHPEAAAHPNVAAEALFHAGDCEAKLRRGERALPFYQATLALAPEHEAALEQLASAALDRGQLERAADLLQRLANLTTDRSTRIARLGVVADLLISSEVDHAARAIETLRRLVDDLAQEDVGDEDLDATRLELLPRAIPQLRAADQHRHVAQAALALARLLEDPPAVCAQLSTAAEAHAAVRDWAAADRCRQRVLELDPRDSRAALGLAQSLESQGQPDAVVQLLRDHLAGLPRLASPEERELRADIYATLARVYRGLAQTDAAIDATEAQLDLREDEGVRRSLVELYADQPRWAVAALANHRKLAGNIENVDSLQALAAASARTEPYRAFCIYDTLAVLGQLDEAGRAFLEGFQPKEQVAADTYDGELTLADRQALLSADGATALREVFQLLGDATSLLLPKQLADFGVGTADRVSPVEKTPLALVFSACARALGTKTTTVYLRRDAAPGDEQVIVAAMARPALLVPPGIGERLPLGQLRFVIGRAVELTQPAALFATGFEPRDFARMLQTVLCAFHPRHMRRRGIDEARRREAEELRRGFPYKAGRRLGELFRERPDLPFDSAAWRRAVHISANRVGLVLSGDLRAAVSQLCAEDPQLSDLPLYPDAMRRSALLRDLLTFAASDAYYACRVKLGVST